MKICNLDYLRSHSPNNPKFVVLMIQMFISSMPPYMLDIKTALTALDWDKVFAGAHKIRPSIDLIGMPDEIGNIAKQIEIYSKERNNLNLLPDLFSKLEEAFRLAYIELEEELKMVTGTQNS
jgi:HPt (histidine-containing phosphotransfer) domain-containing protein